MREAHEREARLGIPAGVMSREQSCLCAFDVASTVSDPTELVQRPPQFPSQIRAEFVASKKGLHLGRVARPAQAENLGAVDPATPMETPDRVGGAPSLHCLGPLLGQVILREPLQGANELAVDDACRKRVEIAGDRRYPRVLEERQLSLLAVPSGEAFVEQAGPAFEAYATGDHEEALAIFMNAVSGMEWARCRALLDERVPGAVAQAIKDADTFFAVELPALMQWTFGVEQAGAIHQPTLSVLGSNTQPLWVDVASFLRAWLPNTEEKTIDGVGHLLHIERPDPVARAIAQFLGRHRLTGN